MQDIYISSKPEEEEANHKLWKETAEKVVKDAGERPRRELWGAYHVLPHEKFITQQQDETIVLLLRSHPITNIGWMLTVIMLVVLPFLITASGIFPSLPNKYLFMGQLIWLMATMLYGFERFLSWYYSVFIVTNERILDVDFENLMYRRITYGNLNHIEEPVSSARGFAKTMFQFGDVLVQTAGEVSTLEALGVPHPSKVVDIISRLSEELEKRREIGQ